MHGIDVNYQSMALSLFHNDYYPILYVSNDYYHCFACRARGNVIDLSSKLFDLRLYDAVRKLASNFYLALDKHLPETIHQKLKPHSSFVRTSSCAFLFWTSIGGCSWIGKNGMHRKHRKMCRTNDLWKPATVYLEQSVSWTSCCKAILYEWGKVVSKLTADGYIRKLQAHPREEQYRKQPCLDR